MESVQFNEEQPVVRVHPEKVSVFTKLALATGLVTTPRGAQILLLVVGALALLVAVFFFLSRAFGRHNTQHPAKAPTAILGHSVVCWGRKAFCARDKARKCCIIPGLSHIPNLSVSLCI